MPEANSSIRAMAAMSPRDPDENLPVIQEGAGDGSWKGSSLCKVRSATIELSTLLDPKLTAEIVCFSRRLLASTMPGGCFTRDC